MNPFLIQICVMKLLRSLVISGKARRAAIPSVTKNKEEHHTHTDGAFKDNPFWSGAFFSSAVEIHVRNLSYTLLISEERGNGTNPCELNENKGHHADRVGAFNDSSRWSGGVLPFAIQICVEEFLMNCSSAENGGQLRYGP
jgi:hypothetical protein